MVSLRRDHSMVVPICSALVLANPCNMATYLMADLGRWNRDAALYRARVEAGQTDAVPPPLPLLAEYAARVSEYVAKYITKPDLQTHTSDVAHACHVLIEAGDQHRQGRGGQAQHGLPAGKAAQRAVARCLHAVHGSMSYPAPLVCLYLSNALGDSTTSFDTQYFPHLAFTARMHSQATPEEAEARAAGGQLAAAIVPASAGNAWLVTDTEDYRMRGAGLSLLSPWAFTAMCEKMEAPAVQAQKRERRRKAKQAGPTPSAEDTGDDGQAAPPKPKRRRRPAQEEQPSEWPPEEVQGEAGMQDAPLPQPQASARTRERVPFQKRHPQSRTHCLALRTSPVLPQFCRDVPARPPPDAPP